jgi:hypothetical protein
MLLAIVESIDLVEEENMPTRTWRLRRRPSPRPDGQQRWDRAYLRLLQWTQLPLSPQQPAESVTRQEDTHDSRAVCTRLDPAPGPHANN